MNMTSFSRAIVTLIFLYTIMNEWFLDPVENPFMLSYLTLGLSFLALWFVPPYLKKEKHRTYILGFFFLSFSANLAVLFGRLMFSIYDPSWTETFRQSEAPGVSYVFSIIADIAYHLIPSLLLALLWFRFRHTIQKELKSSLLHSLIGLITPSLLLFAWDINNDIDKTYHIDIPNYFVYLTVLCVGGVMFILTSIPFFKRKKQ